MKKSWEFTDKKFTFVWLELKLRTNNIVKKYYDKKAKKRAV